MSFFDRRVREDRRVRALALTEAASYARQRALELEKSVRDIESHPPVSDWLKRVADDCRVGAKELRALEAKLRELADG